MSRVRADEFDTRRVLLRTAERLYAERGLAQVSNRQVAQQAGQANNSAVAYHIGTKSDLVHAICRGHADAVCAGTLAHLERVRGSLDPRDHVAALVLPWTEHLAGQGNPSWTARFTAQVLADPIYGPTAVWHEGVLAAHLEGGKVLESFTPPLPERVRLLRLQMMRILVVHTCAEREAEAAVSGVDVEWSMLGDALVDAVTEIVLAPDRARSDMG